MWWLGLRTSLSHCGGLYTILILAIELRSVEGVFGVFGVLGVFGALGGVLGEWNSAASAADLVLEGVVGLLRVKRDLTLEDAVRCEVEWREERAALFLRRKSVRTDASQPSM